jgi:glutamate-ammonia-ligase adenylyltransferase
MRASAAMIEDLESGGESLVWPDPPRRIDAASKAEARKWLAEAQKRLRETGFDALADELSARPEMGSFLAAVFSHSSHLRDVALLHPEHLAAAVGTEPAKGLKEVLDSVSELGRSGIDETELMARLRHAKARMSLLLGLADIGGWWRGEQITAALTSFADAALGAACDHLILTLAAAGKVTPVDANRPQAGSGLIVLGMG